MAVVNSFALFAAARYPAVDKVVLGVEYGDSNNNFTGTLGDPSAPTGTPCGVLGNILGDNDHPAEGDVRLGIAYNNGCLVGRASAGTECDYPGVDDVRDGVTYDKGQATGNYEPALEADVKLGVFYGSQGVEYQGQYVCDTGTPGDPEWLEK